MDRHASAPPLQHGQVSLQLLYEGKWAGADKANEHAVGKEFARALLVALWPEKNESAEWREWQEEHDILGILEGDLSEATTPGEKDKLTFGMYTELNESAEFRKEVEVYAASAHEKKEVVSDDLDVDNPPPRVSAFGMIWNFPLLYEWARHAIFLAVIHEQLVGSVFSKYDTCTQQHDSREIDIVRLGQFRSAQSRRIRKLHASNHEIREAGNKAIAEARALRKAASEAVPNERQQRKRGHDVTQFVRTATNKAKYGPGWQVRSVLDMSESESESDVSAELSGEEDD
ncbi:hypothetical protein Esi_0336_0026 [Ectocarpus siliculosus]|uniref:Uncharacterized protein n=1 Tax=Ectocarpus siliculosus TaxID=2880 RepID=D7FXZ1_ECTSI|nr:hypothetical protein Esi_0336_0026 [Ectocarpus siliculosus]|eukprot:CBJ32404.1 hypothetical protein Esi_0336_0026 [Ectocarpus siliculosus]